MIAAAIIAGWWALGMAGFIFHETYENDVELSGLVIGSIVAILGPLSWVVGYLIYPRERPRPPRVVIRRRGR